MAAKKSALTVAFLKKPPAVKKGTRKTFSDFTKGLSARVNDKGQVTFVYISRFAGKANPEPRTVGTYQEGIEQLERELLAAGRELPRPPALMSLARAREIAAEWATWLSLGIDPRDREFEIANERARRRGHTFKSVVEDYLKDIPNRKRNRHAEQDEREIRRELLQRTDKAGKEWINPWSTKPISEVTDGDIAELIGAIRDRPAAGMAYNAWGHIKAIFSWAMWPERRQGYRLTTNPTQHLQPKHFRLSKTVSTRVLRDSEISALWSSAEATPYPLGPFYKLLLLTGQRKAECSDAEWKEFDLKRKLWTVPAERFKSGQTHVVPLSSDVIALLATLPRFEGDDSGDCLFSTTNGRKPINGFSRAKAALDVAMLAALRENDGNASLADWVFHDVRRTVRTRLSGLRINSEIAEMVIGHGKTGIERVYNHHEYEDEMREALDRWASVLFKIVNPAPANNVVDLRAG